MWLFVLLAQSRIAGSGGNPIIVLVAAGAGVMSCTAGYLLRKQRRTGALLAGGALALSLLMAIRTSTLRGPADYLLLGSWALPFFLAIRGWPTLR